MHNFHCGIDVGILVRVRDAYGYGTEGPSHAFEQQIARHTDMAAMKAAMISMKAMKAKSSTPKCCKNNTPKKARYPMKTKKEEKQLEKKSALDFICAFSTPITWDSMCGHI